MMEVAEEVEKYIVELGVEGRLIETQYEEIMIDIKKEIEALIKDYYLDIAKLDLNLILKKFRNLADDENSEIEEIAFILGYKKRYETLDQKVVPRGYRLLGKIKRLNLKDIGNLSKSFDGLPAIIDASEDELSEIDGISKIKARSIKNEIRRLMITIEFEKKLKL